MRSIRVLLTAAHDLVRGLAVIVLVWSVGHIGVYALSVVGVSSVLLTTPADARPQTVAFKIGRFSSHSGSSSKRTNVPNTAVKTSPRSSKK
jgi:hypothetical protein